MQANFVSVGVLGKPQEVRAGFFVAGTRVENKAEFSRLAWTRAGFEPKTPLFLKQAHSGTVVQVLNGHVPSHAPAGDAIITDSKNAFLVIQVADCLPVLFFDPLNKLVAGAHAGWKGSLLGIVPAVVQKLVCLGSRPEQVRIWMGPSIRACCYEVDVERAVLFPRKNDSKRCIDLVSFNLKSLVAAGVRKESVFIDRRCTACSGEAFPSYRREGKKAGRIFACLALG